MYSYKDEIHVVFIAIGNSVYSPQRMMQNIRLSWQKKDDTWNKNLAEVGAELLYQFRSNFD